MRCTTVVLPDEARSGRGVAATLRGADACALADTADAAAGGRRHVRLLQPALVLIDLPAPGGDGQGPSDLLLTVRRDANGYQVETIRADDVELALRLLPDDVSPSTPASEPPLTERERTVLRSAARGLPNQSIARELSVTEGTIKFHLSNIYKKLGTSNRTQAALIAHRLGLAESPRGAEGA